MEVSVTKFKGREERESGSGRGKRVQESTKEGEIEWTL